MVKAKKHLGQHFLKDENIASKIVEAINPNCDHLVEIGPGTGVLTKYLIPLAEERLKVIEIDQESVHYLDKTYPALNGKILATNFLRLDLKEHFPGTIHIIGNLPYNISSQIFFHILSHRNQVKEVVAMIQKEVAERLAAPAGTKKTGILSVYLQSFYEIEYLFTVGEQVFYPPPKVKSAVIRLKRNDRNQLDCDEKLFLTLIKTAFGQRRKTIRNSLKSIFIHLDTQREIFSKRPEQLSIEEFVLLTQWATEIKSQSARKENYGEQAENR